MLTGKSETQGRMCVMYRGERSLAAKNQLSHQPRAGLTRRGFMTNTAATGAALGLGSLIVPAPARAATRGGHFRMAMSGGGPADSLDPALMASEYPIALSLNLNGFLTYVDPDGNVMGDLAESWEGSEGATVWVFELRNGATFHNGKPVTSDDVVASLNYHRGEDSRSTVKPLVSQIADIRADGAQTVTVTLVSGNADFPMYLSDPRLPILPSSEGTIDWQSGIGAGAYRLEAFEPGVVARLAKFENDWNDARGWFDTAEMLLVNDSNARLQALQGNSVDAIARVNPKIAALLQAAGGFNLYNVTTAQYFTWAMDTTIAPLDNNDIRLALKYAYDREQFVETVLGGYGMVANDHPVSPAHQFFAADLEQRVYDPERAKFHLSQAGMDRLAIDMSASEGAFAGSVDAASLFAESAAAANIDVRVIREPGDGYWNNVWMKKPFFASYWSGRPTADWILTDAFTADAAYNESRYRGEELNRLISAARSELDTGLRAEMYRDIQIILRDQGGNIIPAFGQHLFATSSRVQTPGVFARRFEMDDYRGIQNWWFG
jgi:peptide/nickel transport system substrate-binding protein